MSNRESQQTAQGRRPGQRSRLVVCVAGVTAMLAGISAAMVLASGSTAPTLTANGNSSFSEEIVGDTHGRTLYALSPETTHHLLCKSRECLKFWPPLTVRSTKTKLAVGAGVRGHLGILRRSNGMLQVTLGGRPLYRFSGDAASGAAKGENIHSFGGAWHVLSAVSGAPLEPAMAEGTPRSTSTSTTSTSSEPYGY